MKKKFVACLCLLLLLFYLACSDTAYAASKRKKKTTAIKATTTLVETKLITVTAEGTAPLGDGNKAEASKIARQELMRNALDKAIGSYVESVTKMENFQVVSDRVFSQSKGMVKDVQVTREWIDEYEILHIEAICKVSELTLDSKLGPAVIDALGNPRVMILLDNPTAQSQTQKIFEKNGYMIINPTHAQILKEIDLDAARAGGDYSKIRDVARDFHADVLITGRATARTVNAQKIYGQTLYAVASTVRLEAVLSDTAQTIGSEEFSWRPSRAKECSFSEYEGAVKGLTSCSTQAAESIVNKIAYALTSGAAGSLPGRTVKILLKNIDYRSSRSLQDSLANIQGVTGVYQRRYLNGSELELDIVSDKSADEVADLLFELGIEITGVSNALVEGSKGKE